MAEAANGPPTLSEQYLLEKEKQDVIVKPVEEKEDEKSPSAVTEEVVVGIVKETPAAVVEEKPEEKVQDTAVEAAQESAETTAAENSSEDAPAPAEESNEATEEESAGGQEDAPEEPEIKLETAPADYRFPTTNQTRHCFTRYIEYHRCIAAKGEGTLECDKFAKYYRALCPGEWVDRWNEQRENGTFPGPL